MHLKKQDSVADTTISQNAMRSLSKTQIKNWENKHSLRLYIWKKIVKLLFNYILCPKKTSRYSNCYTITIEHISTLNCFNTLIKASWLSIVVISCNRKSLKDNASKSIKMSLLHISNRILLSFYNSKALNN